jgi:hypothetical protein
MTHREDVSGMCPLCRAFGRFKVRVAQLEETPSRCGEVERLFTTGCWIVAALERTSPCGAHRKTLCEAQTLAEDLARLVEEEKEASWIRE